MARTVTPFLMFDGVAEDAMKFYVSLFKNSEIRHVERHGPGEQGVEGSIKRADYCVGGQRFMGIDSPMTHDFGFTPSMSIFVECENAEELRAAFGTLSSEGSVLMPLDNDGFSAHVGNGSAAVRGQPASGSGTCLERAVESRARWNTHESMRVFLRAPMAGPNTHNVAFID